MKRSELFFSALLVPVDYLMVCLAGIVAYQIRFGGLVQGFRPVFYEINQREYTLLVAVVAVVFVLSFALSGLYAIRSSRGFIAEIGRIIVACSAAMTLVIVIVFFQRELFSSRFIVLIGWILGMLFTTFGRALIRSIQRVLLRKGVGTRGVAMIGSDTMIEELIRQLYTRSVLGLRVVERYKDFSEETQRALSEKITAGQVDELIVGSGTFQPSEMLTIKEFADDHHVAFSYLAGLFESQTAHVTLTTIADIPVIEVLRTRLDGWGKIGKRIFDIAIAGIVCIVASPLLIIISLLIKIDSTGPVHVTLDRIGEKGKNFKLYKFRSMVKNAHTLKKELLKYNERRDGPLFKIKDDPRVTRIGRVLRKLSLDELLQLINVLKGDMSLVGPRPHEPEEVSKYERWQKRLLTIKPGMTGLAQISGRSDLRFEDEARLDIYYIENWSLALDIRIILRTPWVVLTAKSAS